MKTADRITAELGPIARSVQIREPDRVYFEIKPSDIIRTADLLFRVMGLRFVTASGTDLPEGIEILYHFADDENNVIVTAGTLLKDKNKPGIYSLSHMIKCCSWIERELHELLGVDFMGSSDQRRLLLPEDWPEGSYPLRNGTNGGEIK